MLRNYLTTALRNLLRDRTSAIINIAGLTLGITGSLVLFLTILYYSSFDTFHTKRDRIYRVVNHSDGDDGKDYQPGVPAVLPDAFRLDFPEAEAVVFASYRSGSLVTIPQLIGEPKKYEEERGIVFTEPSFFSIFDRDVLLGDAAKGLDEANEAVIGRSLAIKYFGKEDAIGEVLTFENAEYRIAAVVQDAPSNTDFPFDLMLSYITVKKEVEARGWNSIWSDEQCYVLLREGESAEKLEARLPAFYTKHLGKNNPEHSAFTLQSLKDLHFDDRYGTFSYSTISRGMLTAFGVIALFLIVTACINFINLSTAEAMKRSKEVGVRKSLGSSRGQLITQFLGETTMVTLLAVVLSVALVQVVFLFLNPFLKIDLSLDFNSNIIVWLCIAGVTIIVSVLSGLYPAFVVSGFKPAQALKSQLTSKNSSGYALRRGLVVLQFSISQLFIIGTIVITKQMDYFQSKDLGFSKEAILEIPIPESETPLALLTGEANVATVSKMRTLRDEALRLPGVQKASLNQAAPSSGHVSSTDFRVEGDEKAYGTQVKQADGNYIDLFDLKLVAGQNFQDLDTASGYIVNEKLARTTGHTDVNKIIGKTIKLWGKTLPVIGVVKDFHTMSLHEPIGTTVIFSRIRGYKTLALKVDMKQSQNVIAEMRSRWEAAYPTHIFSYDFLDEDIKEFYEHEQKMSVLLSIFTSIAIFIGCLGLFGLATFIANQKTKEIGVRKVLGASVESIVLMFSKEYARLILVGFVVATPFAWFILNQFLSEFAYRIELGPVAFLAGLGVTLVIAVLTVGYKSLKAAVANPVKSLKYE